MLTEASEKTRLPLISEKRLMRIADELAKVYSQGSATANGRLRIELDRMYETLDHLGDLLEKLGSPAGGGDHRGSYLIGAEDKLYHLRDQGRTMCTELERARNESLPTADQFFDQLKDLETSFERPVRLVRELGFKPGNRCLLIETDDIRLEDPSSEGTTFNFGPFLIGIDIDELARRDDPTRALFAKAITPMSPQGDSYSSYYHPHVEYSGKVCMGSGRESFENAIKNGRIADAITVVRSVLMTYNPHSPYVTLDMWLYPRGRCESCRGVISMEGFDEICGSCEIPLCNSCSRYCESDNVTYCPQCARSVYNETECPSCSSRDSCSIFEAFRPFSEDEDEDDYEDDRFSCGGCGELFHEDDLIHCPIRAVELCEDCADVQGSDDVPCRVMGPDGPFSCDHAGESDCPLALRGFSAVNEDEEDEDEEDEEDY